MLRYGTKTRIALFVLLMAAMVLSAGRGFAQAAADAPAAQEIEPGTFSVLMSLILENMDVVFFTIMVCSIFAVALIIKGALQLRASVMLPEASVARIRELISRRQFRELLEFTERDGSFVSKALNPALKRAPRYEQMREAMETAVGEETAEQFRRIEYLNIIGNLGPLLGLLGTVMGMISAFAALKAAGGNADAAQLAGGISAALTHTFLGLMLAVPCLAAFGVFRTIVDRLTIRGTLLAEEMLRMLKPSEAEAPAGEVCESGVAGEM